MTDKIDTIVDAATQMFARYGYAKTTIGDIAETAGVARQTVYNAFPGKEEILRQVVRRAGQQTYDDVVAAWETAPDVTAKMTAFHESGPVNWYEVIHKTPDWAELLEGMNKAASEEIKVLEDQWKAAFSGMLAEVYAGAPDGLADIVDFFYGASYNAKYGVADVAHLRRRLATIRRATLALLDQAPVN